MLSKAGNANCHFVLGKQNLTKEVTEKLPKEAISSKDEVVFYLSRQIVRRLTVMLKEKDSAFNSGLTLEKECREAVRYYDKR